jgi:hypothetical protein
MAHDEVKKDKKKRKAEELEADTATESSPVKAS